MTTTATDVTFLVSDRGATAYLMLEGVRLLGIKEQGTWMFYEMDNSDGRAQRLFDAWKNNTARVAPRAFSEQIRQVNRLGKFN